MISHTMGIIKKSGLPCFIIDSLHQHGNNFGERFTDAIEQVFHAGFEHVVVIGNDCPALTATDLQTAALQLETVDYVIGPSTDGGFYLFGVNQRAFDKQAILSAPWKTDRLFEYFTGYLAAASLSSFVSDVKGDVDSTQDLNSIYNARSIAGIRLINLIRSIISSIQREESLIHPFVLRPATNLSAGLRAPPQPVF